MQLPKTRSPEMRLADGDDEVPLFIANLTERLAIAALPLENESYADRRSRMAELVTQLRGEGYSEYMLNDAVVLLEQANQRKQASEMEALAKTLQGIKAERHKPDQQNERHARPINRHERRRANALARRKH